MLCSSPVWCQVWMSIRLATTSASTVSTGESLFFFPLGGPLEPADNDGTKDDHKSDRNDNKHDPEHRVKAVEAIRIIIHRHLSHLLSVPFIQGL